MANPSFVYDPPMSPYLDILYQDEAIIVANKPSGLLSVPGKAAAHKDALINRVQRVYPSASVVHRLDMATSGIMIMAITKNVFEPNFKYCEDYNNTSLKLKRSFI